MDAATVKKMIDSDQEKALRRETAFVVWMEGVLKSAFSTGGEWDGGNIERVRTISRAAWMAGALDEATVFSHSPRFAPGSEEEYLSKLADRMDDVQEASSINHCAKVMGMLRRDLDLVRREPQKAIQAVEEECSAKLHQAGRIVDASMEYAKLLTEAATEARDILGNWQERGLLWSTCEATIWAAWKKLDLAVHRAALANNSANRADEQITCECGVTSPGGGSHMSTCPRRAVNAVRDRSPDFRALELALHPIWTACVGLPGYDKRPWQDVQNQLLAAMRDSPAQDTAR